MQWDYFSCHLYLSQHNLEPCHLWKDCNLEPIFMIKVYFQRWNAFRKCGLLYDLEVEVLYPVCVNSPSQRNLVLCIQAWSPHWKIRGFFFFFLFAMVSSPKSHSLCRFHLVLTRHKPSFLPNLLTDVNQWIISNHFLDHPRIQPGWCMKKF